MKPSELLNSPEKWTQGSLARKANGDRCSPFDVEATCWCLAGAFSKYFSDLQERVKAVNKLEVPIVQFNDYFDRKYDEVIHLLKKAGL